MPWPLGHVANAHGSFSDWGHPLSLSLSLCLALANIFTHACALAAPSPLTSPTTGYEATICEVTPHNWDLPFKPLAILASVV
ncbi:unnamed protein product [Acanthoscelides obtectus]|uniref:Secreted protein n=1 Tax=Acanthoscelides obtectus TaxID=200917 RepID=A0A9P0NYB3_ACAOB|nr:unnamed protein product [Acanthoscelides obtectus]CAK1679451.1 hypothetical protein AOBTE_LOCUS32255 [Acanthoscelides obtectus]